MLPVPGSRLHTVANVKRAKTCVVLAHRLIGEMSNYNTGMTWWEVITWSDTLNNFKGFFFMSGLFLIESNYVYFLNKKFCIFIFLHFKGREREKDQELGTPSMSPTCVAELGSLSCFPGFTVHNSRRLYWKQKQAVNQALRFGMQMSRAIAFLLCTAPRLTFLYNLGQNVFCILIPPISYRHIIIYC